MKLLHYLRWAVHLLYMAWKFAVNVAQAWWIHITRY